MNKSMHPFHSHIGIFVIPSFVKAQNLGGRRGYFLQKEYKKKTSSLLKTYFRNMSSQNNVVIHLTLILIDVSIHHIVYNA